MTAIHDITRSYAHTFRTVRGEITATVSASRQRLVLLANQQRTQRSRLREHELALHGLRVIDRHVARVGVDFSADVANVLDLIAQANATLADLCTREARERANLDALEEDLRTVDAVLAHHEERSTPRAISALIA